MIVKKTFEETYPHYEFSPLVTWAIQLGAWLARSRRSQRRAPAAAELETIAVYRRSQGSSLKTTPETADAVEAAPLFVHPDGGSPSVQARHESSPAS